MNYYCVVDTESTLGGATSTLPLVSKHHSAMKPP